MTITYKSKEYQEVAEELFESCKGCAFEIEGCKRGLPCGENNSIYKEIGKKIDNPEFYLTKSELTVLINYHKDKIQYAWDRMETQEDIANKEPLYTFGPKQTKKDWEDSAEEWNKTAQYHEDRANRLNCLIKKGEIMSKLSKILNKIGLSTKKETDTYRELCSTLGQKLQQSSVHALSVPDTIANAYDVSAGSQQEIHIHLTDICDEIYSQYSPGVCGYSSRNPEELIEWINQGTINKISIFKKGER